MNELHCSKHRDRAAVYLVEYNHVADGEPIYSRGLDCEECAETRKTKRGAEHLTFTPLHKTAEEAKPEEKAAGTISNPIQAKPMIEGHDNYCTCKTCSTAYKKLYKIGFWYIPGYWGARNKQTNQKVVFKARSAKETRALAAQYFNIPTSDIAVSPHANSYGNWPK